MVHNEHRVLVLHNIREEKIMEECIDRFRSETKEGHTINFFFNHATNLVVVDYIYKNEVGGNELLRKTLDPKVMLAHCKPKRHKKVA